MSGEQQREIGAWIDDRFAKGGAGSPQSEFRRAVNAFAQSGSAQEEAIVLASFGSLAPSGLHAGGDPASDTNHLRPQPVPAAGSGLVDSSPLVRGEIARLTTGCFRPI